MALTEDQLASIFPNPLLNATGVVGISFPNYSNYSRSLYLPTRRSEFEGNVISVRKKIGAVRRLIYAMVWEKMTEDDLNVLETHFATYYGDRFVFYPPEILLASDPTQWTDAQKEENAVFCVYAEDTLKATMSGYERYRVDVSLYEAIDNSLLNGGEL